MNPPSSPGCRQARRSPSAAAHPGTCARSGAMTHGSGSGTPSMRRPAAFPPTSRPSLWRSGEPGRALVSVASQAGDLLVVGTGRHGGLSRLLHGTVSRYCVAHARCPVLAVPPPTLELEVGYGLRSWAFRHRTLNLDRMKSPAVVAVTRSSEALRHKHAGGPLTTLRLRLRRRGARTRHRTMGPPARGKPAGTPVERRACRRRGGCSSTWAPQAPHRSFTPGSFHGSTPQSRPRGLCTRRQTCNSSHLPSAGFAAPRGAASGRSPTPSATRCAIRKGPGPSGNRPSPVAAAMACRAPPAPRWRLRASAKPPRTRQGPINRRQGSGQAGHAGGPAR